MDNCVFPRFPGGRDRALTLSYDDGVEQDARLIRILDRHGLKCTFNLNSGLFAPEGRVYEKGVVHRRMTEARVLALLGGSAHETGLHGLTHPFLEQLAPPLLTYEILEDRRRLEKLFGRLVRGGAYPFGTYSDAVVEALRACGVKYCRTTVSTGGFGLPEDWLRLDPTCHHNDSRLMALADSFMTDEVTREPYMFYLWGHSYEFESDDNWDVIERFAGRTGGGESVYYATNIEIFDYLEAYSRLLFSADGSMMHNPTAVKLWLVRGEEMVSIEPGETVGFG